MKKLYILLACLLAISPLLLAQKAAQTGISKSNISLRGNPVVLGQVTINTPSTGKVILRFDGQCLSAVGDRIVLAASETTDWGPASGNNFIELEATSADITNNPFSHTRSFDVAAGAHTYYAVAQNFYELDGTGMASVYGSLTAEWFPEIAGQPFARHKGVHFESIQVEGAPTAFSSITIDAPTAGKVLVRFDGKCSSNYGDLIFFAASDTPDWGDLDGSTSNEVISNTLNHFSFAHTRSYNVEAGSHTFYGVIENYYEVYGNGYISGYGNLTVEFYPAAYEANFAFQTISTQFGVTIDGPPVPVGTINMNAPVSGKVVLNFAGTCIASNGDQVRLAASDVPNWSENDGCVQYEPYSSDHNRTSFSHTRVYDVAPGDHTYYAVVQNYEEYEGSGLAVIYASFSAEFFPDASSAVQTQETLCCVQVSPNPASEFVNIAYPDLATGAISLTLCDETGKVWRRVDQLEQGGAAQTQWEIADLPKGVYFVKLTHASGSIVRKFIRI